MEGDPIRKPAVSNNLDTGDLTDIERSTKQHMPFGMRIITVIQKRTAWSGLSERRCPYPMRELKLQGLGDLVVLGRGDGDIFLEMSEQV